MWLSDSVYLSLLSLFIATALSPVAAFNRRDDGGGIRRASQGDEEGMLERHFCEGEQLYLACTVGTKHVLYIRSAEYAVAPPGLCGGKPGSHSPPHTSCSSRAQQHVQSMCNNQSFCNFTVNRGLFVSSCPADVTTYLKVEQMCRSLGPTATTSFYLSTATAPILDPEQRTTPRTGDGTCPMVERRSIVWPETQAGSTATGTCPNYASGSGTWICGTNPVRWIGDPNLERCVSPSVSRLKSEVLSQKGATFNHSSYRTVVDKMVSYSREKEIYGGDIPVFSSIMKELVNQINDTMQDVNKREEAKAVVVDVTGAILQTSSNLLREEIWADLPKDTWSTGATEILSAVESIAFQLAETNQSSINITDNIVLQVHTVESSKSQDLVFPPTSSLRDSTTWSNTSTAVRLSKETVVELSQKGRANVVFAMYKNVASLMAPKGANRSQTNEPLCAQYSNCSMQPFVNSDVISASVNAPHSAARRMNLKHEVVFTLQHSKVENATDAKCAFWEYSEEKSTGDWSTEGCRVVETKPTHTTCACNHLTNFAIIMSPTQPDISAANQLALSIITYFGCTISIVCLLLAFITFQFFRNLQCDRNSIHKNLCLTLLVANIVFLVGIMQYNIPVLCSIVAATLHYFFLAAFAWMCLEGVQLYVMLVEVFEAEKSRVLWYYIGAYGCPAIIVASSAAIYHQGYGTKQHCWLTTERGFIWAFLGPVICILVANSFMLGVAIRAMIQHAKSAAALRMKEKTKLEQIRLWLKGTIILVFLLGLTWLFGLMYVSASTLVFAYIFTILNSLQGLFIFVFHCVLNDKVQTEYRKLIRRSTCLPESFRNKYGEKSKSTAYSSTPINSAGNSGKGNVKVGVNRNTDSSEITTLSKSTANARNSSDNHRANEEMPPLIHAAVDSGIDDPPSYSEAPATHHNETEINGNSVTDVADNEDGSPREPSTADYLETIKDRRRIAESLSARHSNPVDAEIDSNSDSHVAGSIPTTADLFNQRSRQPQDRQVSASSDEEDFGPERSLVKKKVGRLSSVTAV